MGQFFTAADIHRLVHEPGGRYLLLAPDDRITPCDLHSQRQQYLLWFAKLRQSILCDLPGGLGVAKMTVITEAERLKMWQEGRGVIP